jgi:hypothetical protein
LFSLHKIIVSSFVVFLSAEAFAGDPFIQKIGARETGMARICLVNNDLWSSFSNQGALAFHKTFSFGINYENRFSINELGTRSAGIIVPAGKVILGAVYSYFGYGDFRRQMIGLASGMALSDIISAGIQIDYYSEKTTTEYKDYRTLTCEGGIIVKASEKVNLSLHIFNPVPNSVRKSDLPTSLKAGAMISLNNELSAAVETAFQNRF